MVAAVAATGPEAALLIRGRAEVEGDDDAAALVTEQAPELVVARAADDARPGWLEAECREAIGERVDGGLPPRRSTHTTVSVESESRSDATIPLGGPILDFVEGNTKEVDMESARPRVIGPAERSVAAGPATPGMVREVAFTGDDRWVGFVRSDAGVKSGWHHHGDTDTYFYVLRGAIELEFGPGGRERLAVRAGDFAHVPRGVIHREGTTPDEPGEIALVRIGSGPPVVNVEGPLHE